MNSFQPSRGRVLFEVVLALGMAASLAGASMQTGAVALLGASGVAALYGLIHLFDLRRPKPVAAAEARRTEPEPVAGDILVPMVVAEEPPIAASLEEAEIGESAILPVETVEATAPRASNGRRSGGSRKGSGRRSTKASKAIAEAPADEATVPWPMAEEAVAEALEPTEEFAFTAEEPAHPHIAPLFEPEPFARMPRRAFGRRGRL